MLRFVLALDDGQLPARQAFLQVELANVMQATELKTVMIEGFCDPAPPLSQAATRGAASRATSSLAGKCAP